MTIFTTMSYIKCLYLTIFPIITLLLTRIHGATINIQNNCNYTIWPAVVPGGGQRLESGQVWAINASSGPIQVWARTVCAFDQSGKGTCLTGDCNGLLQCKTYGNPPRTLVELALSQFNNLDFFDISLVEGFNVPVELRPISGVCTRVTRCVGDINAQCPKELRAPGGCNNPCTVFKTEQYCCNSGNCGPSTFSRFFKQMCPDAYVYPSGGTSTLTCPGGTDYKVVFCPR